MFELQKELMQKYGVNVNNIDTKNGQRTIKDLIFNIVEELFEGSNCLKNRVWTQTEPVTDMNHFLEEISDALLFFIEFLIATGLTPEQVFELYLKKHQVNQFRIESKY